MKTRRKTNLAEFMFNIECLFEDLEKLNHIVKTQGVQSEENEKELLHIYTQYATKALTSLDFFMQETEERMTNGQKHTKLRKLLDACGEVWYDLRKMEIAETAEEVLAVVDDLKVDLRALQKRARRYIKPYRPW